MNELKSTLNQIEERANNSITFDKLNEYKNGLKEIEQNNGDKYTADALNEAIQEYKASKSKAINKELGAFDEVLNQAKYNKLYANALLQVQNMLIQNIVDNNHIDTSLEMTLRSRLEDKLNTIKKSILPDDYHELKSLQE